MQTIFVTAAEIVNLAGAQRSDHRPFGLRQTFVRAEKVHTGAAPLAAATTHSTSAEATTEVVRFTCVTRQCAETF
jgi:hypothetical protein